jgi:hypothetical protein
MVTVDRPGMHHHLMRAGRLAQQFSASLPNVPAQNRMPVRSAPKPAIQALSAVPRKRTLQSWDVVDQEVETCPSFAPV